LENIARVLRLAQPNFDDAAFGVDMADRIKPPSWMQPRPRRPIVHRGQSSYGYRTTFESCSIWRTGRIGTGRE
jgi:hypothetical protein